MKNLKCRSNVRPLFWKVRTLFWKVRPLFWKVRPLFWKVRTFFFKCETVFRKFVTNFDFALSDTNSKMCNHRHFGHLIKISVSQLKKTVSHLKKTVLHFKKAFSYFKMIGDKFSVPLKLQSLTSPHIGSLCTSVPGVNCKV